MIKINVLRSLAQQRVHNTIEAAVAEFQAQREGKSFSERHPELGRMIKCQVCGRRHRSVRICIPVYAKDKNGVPRYGSPVMYDSKNRPVIIPSRHGRGRFNRHRNALGLQTIERATLIYRDEKQWFPNIDDKEDEKLGMRSLSHAMNGLRKERKSRRRRLLKITKASRRINRVR